MKKIILLITVLLSLTVLSSCTEAKRSDDPDLSDYTIVYPADYSEWKMTEVKLLKEVIEENSGKEIRIIPDSEETTGKEIILGSTTRKTKYSDTINGFDNAMCYVIGRDEDNIVLGGQNYYSDMRAIYDFIENYLGYDDLTENYGQPVTKTLDTENITLWEQPSHHIMGTSMSGNHFTHEYQIKDFADCNFNLLWISSAMWTSDHKYEDTFDYGEVRDVAKWCAKYGIEIVIQPNVFPLGYTADFSKCQVFICDHEEDVIENPCVFGLYVVDEPQEDVMQFRKEELEYCKEKYGQYGWKFYITVYSPWYPSIPEEEQYLYCRLWEEYLYECDALSFDGYMGHLKSRNIDYCYILETYSSLARELGQEFYYYIECFGMGQKNLNYTKVLRNNAYFGLCFGSTMTEYFQYGDAGAADAPEWAGGSLINKDFSINHEYYDYAQKVNEEILKVTDILKDYEFVGTYTSNTLDEPILRLANPYEHPEEYATDYLASVWNTPIVFGCYENRENGKKALIVLNFEEINDTPYKEDKDSLYLVFEVSKENAGKVVIYREGEIFEPDGVMDNKISIPFGNGSAYLFIIG